MPSWARGHRRLGRWPYGAVAAALEDLPNWFRATPRRLLGPFFNGLEKLHSGLIGDYVCWISIGFAAIVAAFALA